MAAQPVAGGGDRLHRLIERLLDSGQFGAEAGAIQIRETHISVVVLVGPHAYKFKKPVDFGFLDFSTLEKRRLCCEAELRLNRRLAPAIYLDVAAVRGPQAEPSLGGAGEAIEYCVHMRRFEAAAELPALLERGAIGAAEIDDLAGQVAAFHGAIPRVAIDSPFGTPEAVVRPALDNFAQILPLLADDPARQRQLAALRQWTESQAIDLAPVLRERKREEFIRECHGDMHLGNMAMHEGRIAIFDCIEFSDTLRCIDVMSEVAFLMMDLGHRGRPDLAWRFLNRYLEASGDYAGLRVLRFYLTYRALVRAKVAALRLRQPDASPEDRRSARATCGAYLERADTYRAPAQPCLILTHGLCASGKSTVSLPLAQRLGAVRVRSDVERKRLHGMAADARSGSELGTGLYSATVTERTYARLKSVAEVILRAGWPVIADATFLLRSQRAMFRDLAVESRVAYGVLDFQGDEAELRRRIARRAQSGGDASEATLAVLERQMATAEPLTEEEARCRIAVEPCGFDDLPALTGRLAEAVSYRLTVCSPAGGDRG